MNKRIRGTLSARRIELSDEDKQQIRNEAADRRRYEAPYGRKADGTPKELEDLN